jgi:hypothetical protein
VTVTDPDAPVSAAALEAAAEIHHQLFTGLILSLAGLHGMELAAELVFRTFRRQHEARFLAGLRTLRLDGLPPAIACARFIALSNRAGGLDVQVCEQGDRKAWVRYPPPRWAYEGAAICALDNRVSEAFLRAFHARCGVSLGVPGLRFVCTGMTTNGDPGLEGYFEDTGTALGPGERLCLRLGERGPIYAHDAGPGLPWGDERKRVAQRNYAVRYIELMIPVVLELLGRDVGARRAAHAARLIGLQGYRDMARLLGVRDRSRAAFMACLADLNAATGNVIGHRDDARGELDLRVFRLGDDPAVFRVWSALWAGALAVHDPALRFEIVDSTGWRIA